jgi:hypothetical protein
MDNTAKPRKWLLENVPDDVVELVTAYQKSKKKDCGCRYSRSQAIFSMIKKAYKGENGVSLPGGQIASSATVPGV